MDRSASSWSRTISNSAIAWRALSVRGYTITNALCLADARDLVRSGVFSAALLDFKLPTAAGCLSPPELLAANPAMRIVAMSGYATLSSAVLATRDGAIEYLVDPSRIPPSCLGISVVR